MIKIYAPASIGNINVGFDVLGMAISPVDGSLLGDFVTVKSANSFSLKIKGKFANELPLELNKNIVWNCWKNFCNFIQRNIDIEIILEKNIPISSGLGSSACSTVATLLAINIFLKNPLNYQELLIMMGKIEGEIAGSIHYDNVAPCLFGGLQIILNQEKNITQKIPIFKNWIWIIAYPGYKLSTAKSRSILPKKYYKETCIKHSRLLSGFIHACHTKQCDLAIKLMQDIIAEPYRIKLLPKFFNMRESLKIIGALSSGISGSGPSVFAICDKQEIAIKIADWLKKNYLQNNKGFVHICKVDDLGARKLG
ncbi:homoserine kinase [Candidatus Tachikawaea gelatinosa]|uniref:Homoserine kinase n=1 Tax=Candidatus Tachikawaea gelatinosa TaxID=1410383 RepID=A0A090BWL0_9ENTR|nr:homoserine kinase [Candidatus Tachikawaea gelatinosa]BAP58791.1 homoserine kinase [Candidatus Tachikawaea gelatinosa]